MMRTVRSVAMVSEHASPLAALGGVDAGGQNVYVAALASALADLGVQVTVHTRREDPDIAERVELHPGVIVHHVDAGPARPISKDDLPPHMPAFAEVLSRLWARQRPDVVHAHFWMSGQAALDAARPLSIPVAQTFHALGVVKRRHQGDKDTSPPGRLDVERRIVGEVDRVIATCSDEVFELSRFGADTRRVTVIPCGVDLDRFSPAGDVDPRPRTARHRLVSISRLVERKGVADAIAALAAVPDTELLVAGGPELAELDGDPEAGRLRALAAQHGVSDRVHLLGRVDNAAVPALLRSADVVLCTPWYEPFGMVALEAMSCGVPVVATSVGGLVDTVVDGKTGELVPPRDPGRLAAALRSLLGEPAQLADYAAAGAQRARERYGWERIATETLDIYATMAAARTKQARSSVHADRRLVQRAVNR